MRGQQLAERRAACDIRIIPARAGPTAWLPSARCGSSDHPRSCGANEPCVTRRIIIPGSSPLVRGQRAGRITRQDSVGIIPARAGPTPGGAESSLSETDHPRSCGANVHFGAFLLVPGGSSPLVRGQHVPGLRFVDEERIIPARAGPTTIYTGTPTPPTDHPRSCGANGDYVAFLYVYAGSSPLVRGQQDN